MRMRRLVLALALGLTGGCGCLWAGAAAVTLRHEDMDGCGQPEIVLENRYVRVDLLTGRQPAAPVRTWRERLLFRPAPPAPPRYNCRFVGPGWIGNMVFKPTDRRWFAQTVSGAEAWQGIPEEFEEAVRVGEVSPGVWRCLKIGVGLCQGTGRCFRGSLILIDPGHWETIEEDVPGGGKAVTFRQTIAVEEGFGYRFEKRLALLPDDTRLVVSRTLTNTGRQPLSTTWYTHAFWGQARNGAYDENCWATIPLRRGPPGAPGPMLDTLACPIGNPQGAYYWGPVDRDLIGDAWYACGTHEGSEAFLTMLADIPAFYRVWTCPQTYSLEPFRLIRLPPGASERWVETLACGAGLDRLDSHDGVAAYGSSFTPGTEDSPASLGVRALPFRVIHGGVLRLTLRWPDGTQRALERSIEAAAPDCPIAVSLDDVADRLPLEVEARLDPGPSEAGGEPSVRAARLWVGAPPAAGTERLPPHANGAGAVILGPFERRGPGGTWVPTSAAGLLHDYLGAAGFVPVLARDRDGLPAVDGAPPALVACVGLRALPVQAWRRLEDVVRGGGGLLVCAPIEPAAFEFTDLLPLLSAGSQVRAGSPPRDGTREFLRAYAARYQLEPAREHAVTEGLPLFPQATQDIGVLQVLEPDPGALTVLRYRTPAGLLPVVSSPALVLSDYGAGHVAVLASPVDWGVPSAWCLWSRIGEYHRQFFVQTSLWAAQEALVAPGSAPPSSDCGSRPPTE